MRWLQEKKSNWGIKFSGFVSSEIFFNSKQQVTARKGDVILYPKK